jgi:molybdopterin-guanine dinucleotide biosynthesis protein A
MFKTVDLSMSVGFTRSLRKGSNIPVPILGATVIFVLLGPCRAQLILTAMPKAEQKRKRKSRHHDRTVRPSNVEICILAGGLSKRMGHDKSRLRFGNTTMLSHIRTTAQATGLPVRVIRRDCVPKCGPLGGIYTALKTTPADAVLFLACDMPLISAQVVHLVWRHASESAANAKALFVRSGGRLGFPFVLQRDSLESVHDQIKRGEFSLQSLAKALKATILPLKRPWTRLLFNVNTPREWTIVREKNLSAPFR